MKTKNQNKARQWTLTPLICNPSYSGGRHLEDYGSKSVPREIVHKPYLKKKKPITERAVEVFKQ
jgi:hypothetical protein